MDLEALRAQARAVATRMETRINTALGGNREMTADEEAANTADEAELADLKGKITAIEQAGNATADVTVNPHAEAVAAERQRILGLVDLCPASVVSGSLRTAIDGGTSAGDFAIGLAQAAKTRGATVDQLRAGAVQSEQLPAGAKPGAAAGQRPLKGAARSAGIVARAAAMGHAAVAHLAPKG